MATVSWADKLERVAGLIDGKVWRSFEMPNLYYYYIYTFIFLPFASIFIYILFIYVLLRMPFPTPLDVNDDVYMKRIVLLRFWFVLMVVYILTCTGNLS